MALLNFKIVRLCRVLSNCETPSLTHCDLIEHMQNSDYDSSWSSHMNLNKNRTDATVCRYLFTAKLLYMFRVSQHPSSGVLKTVPAAPGTGHTTCTATPLQRGLIGTPSRSDHAINIYFGYQRKGTVAKLDPAVRCNRRARNVFFFCHSPSLQ